MTNIQFTSLEEAFECYGRENLVAIDNLSQIFFYAKHGCQPKFVFPHELKEGRLTCWYLKSETSFVYKKWMANVPSKTK